MPGDREAAGQADLVRRCAGGLAVYLAAVSEGREELDMPVLHRAVQHLLTEACYLEELRREEARACGG